MTNCFCSLSSTILSLVIQSIVHCSFNSRKVIGTRRRFSSMQVQNHSNPSNFVCKLQLLLITSSKRWMTNHFCSSSSTHLSMVIKFITNTPHMNNMETMHIINQMDEHKLRDPPCKLHMCDHIGRACYINLPHELNYTVDIGSLLHLSAKLSFRPH